MRILRVSRLLTILLFAAAMTCLAPGPSLIAQHSGLDSLAAVVHSQKLLKKQNLVELTEKIYSYQSQNPQKVRSLIEEVLAYARQRKDVKGEIRALRGIGQCLIDRKLYDEAMQYFEKCLSLSRGMDYGLGIVQALRGMGVAQAGVKHYDQALANYRQSYAEAERRGHAIEAGRALFNTGGLYRRMDSTARAIDFFKQCLLLFEKVGASKETSHTLEAIGTIYRETGRFAEATECFKKSLALAQARKAVDDIAWAYFRLGWTYSDHGETDAAVTSYKRSLDFTNEFNVGCKRCVLFALTKLYFNTTAFDSAMVYQHELLSILIRDTDSVQIALQTWMLGVIYDGAGRQTEALTHLHQSHRLFSALRDTSGMIRTLNSIGVVYSKIEKQDSALCSYFRCLDLIGRVGRDNVSILFLNIGGVYAKMGINDSALIYMKESIRLFEQEPNKELLFEGSDRVASALRQIAAIYLKTGQYHDAVQTLERAEGIALKADAKTELHDIYYRFSEVYEALKDYPRALEAYKKSIAYHDTLKEHRVKTQINELDAKYQSEKKNQQIAMLEKDRQMQALELDRRQRELALQHLQLDRNRQRAELLASQAELQGLELREKETRLQLERTEKHAKIEENRALKEKSALLEKVSKSDRALRNAFLVGLCLFGAVGFLGYKRIRAKKTEATLRAETAELEARTAEYQAKAAESEMLRLQAESERQRRRAQEAFSRQLINSQEEERRRIAGELHDQLGQDLLVIRNAILTTIDDGKVGEPLHSAAESTSVMLEGVRRLTRDLRPFQLERYGLTSALEAMLNRMAKSVPLQLVAEVDPVNGIFSKEQEVNLYRIVQECLNNVIKHADATMARVSLLRGERTVELRVEDDGKGMNLSDGDESAGFGMLDMRQRAGILDAKLSMQSAPGKGTTVRIVIPIPATRNTTETVPEEVGHA